MLAAGGKTNALGRANEVIDLFKNDPSRLGELYDCLAHEDAWIRMRAIDSLEKICREHPEWIEPYIERFQNELSASDQPSIQWHLAQIYGQVILKPDQKLRATQWLKHLLSTREVDWIVAANAMDTLVKFAGDGSVPFADVVPLLKVQQGHKSSAVVKRAGKLLARLTGTDNTEFDMMGS